MNWFRLIQSIQHELYPKLASAIKSIVNDKENKIDAYDLSENCIEKVMQILKTKKCLPFEEGQYLQRLFKRSKQFKPINIDKYTSRNVIKENIDRDFDVKQPGLSKALLIDIYSVHKSFIFANYHFHDYSFKDFKQDIIQNGKQYLGAKFTKTYLEDLQFEDDLSLYPQYLVRDNMFNIFTYHFAVSFYVNYIKQHLNIKNGQQFELDVFVIPKVVSCLYDDDMIFNYNIDDINHYLISKNICDFSKLRWRVNKMKSVQDITQRIKAEYDADDIKSDNLAKITLIIDCRDDLGAANDMIYIVPHHGKQSKIDLTELRRNYFVGFEHQIIARNDVNTVISHFMFGIGSRIRFYPEMLTTIVPTMYRKCGDESEADLLDRIYSHSFKHGWAVTLEDTVFNRYYKLLTGITHISVNYDRYLLDEELMNTKQYMVHFMELLYHEIQANSNIDADDVVDLDIFLKENEYDSESVIQDIMNDESNIKQHFVSKGRWNVFIVIEGIINKYNNPSSMDQSKICGASEVFHVADCPFITVIIDALKRFNGSNQFKIKENEFNVSELLGAYHHVITVHGLNSKKDENERDEEKADVDDDDDDDDDDVDDDDDDDDDEEEEKDTNYNMVRKYIVDKMGYCSTTKCGILKEHIHRKRELIGNEPDDNNDDDDDSLMEILRSTLNALHCYILHKKEDLYELQREDRNSHFMTTIIDKNTRIDYGRSVLEWFDYAQESKFEYTSFREAIISNPQSTINDGLYLNYARECLLIMISNKDKLCYNLEELIALKIYSDTNAYQSKLRESHWLRSPLKTKQAFFIWALIMYKVHLFASKPIIRSSSSPHSTSPSILFHGFNRAVPISTTLPKYNGPTSVSTLKSVTHSFLDNIEILWQIKPSYSNKFRFMTGINMESISCHKNENEIILMNEWIPILSVCNFVKPNNSMKVDVLLRSLKIYKTKIINKNAFYKKIGFRFDKSWIPIIRNHKMLHDVTASGPTILNRLINELKIKQLENMQNTTK